MLTAVYQLSTDYDKTAFEKDSGNRFYWRANRHRMTAEQVRDSLLAATGSLDTKMGGPSAPLTPTADRRTVYGKVSRYKLDEFLQLFDFPSPNLSAEKRFTTSVPLQRLFFMNSDFMQQQAERLAKKIVNEPDNPARIQKAYRLIFGRPANDEELKAALAFITTEPIKDYEERKSAKDTKGTKDQEGDNPKDTKDTQDTKAAADGGKSEPGSMMSGVIPGAGKPGDEKKLLPVTPWGRYLKILLSSNEFLFID